MSNLNGLNSQLDVTPLPLAPGEQRLHTHPEAGQFYVQRMSGPDFPAEKPFFCCGLYYATERDAVIGFGILWDTPTADVVDNSYARAEWTHGELP